MAVGLGKDVHISYDLEGSYGTAETPTTDIRCVSQGLHKTPDHNVRGSLGNYDQHDGYGYKHIGGPTVHELCYGGFEDLFKLIFGTMATTGASDPYTHAYTCTGEIAQGLGATVQVSDLGITATSKKFAGCKVERAAFSFPGGEKATVNLDWLGVRGDYQVTNLAAAAFDTAPMILGGHLTAQQILSGSATSFHIRSFDFTVENNTPEDFTLGGVYTGSAWNGMFPAEPMHKDLQMVTGSIVVVHTAITFASIIENETLTNNDISLTFTDPNDSDHHLKLDFANCLITLSEPVDSSGEIIQTVDFTAYGDDSTDTRLNVEYKTANEATGG